jgi:ATP-dependent DNA helicase RecG
LGIVPSIELFNGGGSPYISVRADPSNAPISFKGKLYQRLGATTQELKGADLNNFFSRRMGRTWDSFIVPKVKATDIDADALRLFREKSIAEFVLPNVTALACKCCDINCSCCIYMGYQNV